MHAVECDHPVVASRKGFESFQHIGFVFRAVTEKLGQDQTIILPAAAADQIAEMIFRGETGGLDIHKKGVFPWNRSARASAEKGFLFVCDVCGPCLHDVAVLFFFYFTEGRKKLQSLFWYIFLKIMKFIDFFIKKSVIIFKMCFRAQKKKGKKERVLFMGLKTFKGGVHAEGRQGLIQGKADQGVSADGGSGLSGVTAHRSACGSDCGCRRHREERTEDCRGGAGLSPHRSTVLSPVRSRR